MYKKAARVVADLGYSNVKVYPGGVPAWVASGYGLEKSNPLPKVKISTVSTGELESLLGSVVVLDIRSKSLYKAGSIKDCLQVQLAMLTSQVASIPKGKPIVVVDHAGKQVKTAAMYLKNEGFTDVRRMQGGMMAWLGQGLPVDK